MHYHTCGFTNMQDVINLNVNCFWRYIICISTINIIVYIWKNKL